MGIEEQIDRLIDLGEDIKSRLDRLVEMASDHFAGADKMVAEEPANEAEHPAGPMPDPGEGYRLLSKNPPEDLRDGDELFHPVPARWVQSVKARFGYKKQDVDFWYRRKIETAKPPEPEYRQPVLPADAGQYCQFSDDGVEWRSGWLNGWVQRSHQWISHSGGHWRHCRIKKDA